MYGYRAMSTPFSLEQKDINNDSWSEDTHKKMDR